MRYLSRNSLSLWDLKCHYRVHTCPVMTTLSFECSPQVILRYFAVFYVLRLLRDFMSDVFRAQEIELAISRETLAASRCISSLPTLSPVATRTVTPICGCSLFPFVSLGFSERRNKIGFKISLHPRFPFPLYSSFRTGFVNSSL